MSKVILGIIFQVLITAQAATHSIIFTWTDTAVNPTTGLPNPVGTLYNLYQLPGACNGVTTGYTKIASNLAVKTFTQTPVNPGVYCTYVTAISPGGTGESPASTTSQATIITVTILVAPNGISAVVN